VGSSNAYARWFLQRLFPLEDPAIFADTYCLAVAPHLGDVVTVALTVAVDDSHLKLHLADARPPDGSDLLADGGIEQIVGVEKDDDVAGRAFEAHVGSAARARSGRGTRSPGPAGRSSRGHALATTAPARSWRYQR
jgi:hypothetical protein